jgi:hypothetical protein
VQVQLRHSVLLFSRRSTGVATETPEAKWRWSWRVGSGMSGSVAQWEISATCSLAGGPDGSSIWVGRMQQLSSPVACQSVKIKLHYNCIAW